MPAADWSCLDFKHTQPANNLMYARLRHGQASFRPGRAHRSALQTA